MGFLHHTEKMSFGSLFITQKTRLLSLASNKRFLICLAWVTYPVLDQSLWLGTVWLGPVTSHMLLCRHSYTWLSLLTQVSTPMSLLQSPIGGVRQPPCLIFFPTLITLRNYIIYLLLYVLLIVCLFQDNPSSTEAESVYSINIC